MKVMVTGGSGFIGSHVVERLARRGIQVRIYDLIYPDFINELPKEVQKNIDYYQGSLLEEDRVRLASSGVDAVFHLAAVADVGEVARDPRYTEKINVQGTFNVLEAARLSGSQRRIIFASTVWIFQDTPQIGESIQEDSALALPSHFYTATKLAGEAYCSSYSKLYDLPITILRFGVPYGPRARGSIVSAIFVEKALRGEPITIAGDGSQYRKFVYVEDLAEGCVLALKEKAIGKIYNLEGEEIVSIARIAETVREIIGDVEIVHIEGRKGDFSGKDISNEKAKQDLGWFPETSFQEGMEKYIAWYKEHVFSKKQDIASLI